MRPTTWRVVALTICLAAMPIWAAATTRPNFLVIVADDLGFSDLGAFGGEIHTPNLDALAKGGVRFTGFYTAPTCSPTRAMLLTGEDSHRVGLGTMAEMLPLSPELASQPGYEGHLDPRVATLAERLGAAGYRTMMAGKWHLGIASEFQPKARGFQQSFALLQGSADHFGMDQDGVWKNSGAGSTYSEGGAPARFPAGVYTGDYFTERLIGYLQRKPGEERPFFAYLAFNEPHWPLQAPAALIAKYRGRYHAGPQALRKQRLQKMRALGLFDPSTLAAPQAPLAAWQNLTDAQRALGARTMEIYAAMVESLDQNVGRVIAALRKSGELDNTVVVFMSDNGAEGTTSEQLLGVLRRLGLPQAAAQSLRDANSDPKKMGGVGSYLSYGPEWAQAATGPFRLYKGFTNEGGIRAPAFVAGPGVAAGRIVSSALHVRDVLPTLLELAGVQAVTPTSAPAAETLSGGRSWVPILAGQRDSIRSPDNALAWELFFRRGIRRGQWKAVFSSTSIGFAAIAASATDPARWRLYDLRADPGETHDLASAEPVVLGELIREWDRYASENGVVLPRAPVPAQATAPATAP